MVVADAAGVDPVLRRNLGTLMVTFGDMMPSVEPRVSAVLQLQPPAASQEDGFEPLVVHMSRTPLRHPHLGHGFLLRKPALQLPSSLAANAGSAAPGVARC